jgi:hypothetical protein
MSTTQPKTYDPSKVVATFKGNILTGFGKDSKIEVERNEDAVSLDVGCDGEFCRSINRNKSGKLKLTFMQSSPSNDVLSAALAIDELTGAGAGEFSLEDLNGTSLVNCIAWVTKQAPIKRGKTVVENEWTLETGKLEGFNGGNSVVVA